MGVANQNSPRVLELSNGIPSLSKAFEVISTAFLKYCIDQVPDSPLDETTVDLNRVLIAFNGGKD